MPSDNASCDDMGNLITKVAPSVIAGTLFILSELVGLSKKTNKNSITEVVFGTIGAILRLNRKQTEVATTDSAALPISTHPTIPTVVDKRVGDTIV